ncbi:phosphonate metabolism protein PhnM [Desulfitibacter alkalitolerans]|uniref:phosphonate metabolism protein PhnM n=1 Tax=Desulfitibacter alkalitolerans TaxID=264641 RepID=UPI000486E045|nr:phosphonate metabolism protein PhnM [Desulfitibacter alkalitolerans]
MHLIINGQIVLEDTILHDHELLIVDKIIALIRPAGEISPEDLNVIDANGGYVSPGFIDIHSDYIEHMASPRPTSILDFKMAIREVEKQLVNQGITTMYHSLSLFKDSLFPNKKIRSTENVKRLIDLIEETNGAGGLIHHKFHARYEIDNVDDVEYILKFVRENKIHLLSFMDHTPGQGQYRDLAIYKEIIKGYQDMEDHEVENHIYNGQNAQKLDLETIIRIAKITREHNIALASHDDDTIEKLDLVKSFGTTISEFPITMEVARAARQRGMYTVAGAPNVLLGGSHSGNLSAVEAINEGCIDVLCSDYYPASLLHAVFMLHKKFKKDLAEMFRLVTINPARAVGIDREYGSIGYNKKANIIIIEEIETGFPTITAAFVHGKLVSQLNYPQRNLAV